MVEQDRDWIIMSDGYKALFLGDKENEIYPNLKTQVVRELAKSPASISNSKKLGRVHQSTEHFHSSVEQTEPPEAEEEIFIVGLAARLNQLVITGAAKHLIMVAPARVHRLIRKRSSAAVKSVIYAELARDLTQWPIDESEMFYGIVNEKAPDGPGLQPGPIGIAAKSAALICASLDRETHQFGYASGLHLCH